MLKVISTYIAGVNYSNDNKESRKDILANIPLDESFILKNFIFCGKKAVKILTKDNKDIGNIPQDLAETIYDANSKGKVLYVIYKPQYYNDHSKAHNIKIYIKN